MLHIAIVEDEERYAAELEEFIRRYGEETSRQISVTHYQDGEDLVEDYRGGFDILLMDIQMKFMDGMTAAEKIREQDQEVQIIFITNRNDYAIRGYEVDALDYVLKPVSYYIFGSIIFLVGLTMSHYRLLMPSASLDMNLRQCFRVITPTATNSGTACFLTPRRAQAS